MKKVIFFLLFASGFSYHATAQQKPKTNYMVITISELNGVPVGKPLPNMIVTRTDSVQELKYVNLALSQNLEVDYLFEEAEKNLF